jgi:glycosyltransferase involved in cell wall biosynthesis
MSALSARLEKTMIGSRQLTTQTPTFSISIEWENSRFADLDRTRQMLRALRAQLIALTPPAEPPCVNLLYDPVSVDGETVHSVVEKEFQPSSVPAVTRIIQSEGLRYYQQKNFGARLSKGELTIFLDCDVIPEPGWLAALIDSFKNPEVAVAAGRTHVEHRSFYSKAFALFWFFELKDSDGGLQPTTYFHANNVAFRSDVFLANPFPELPTYRGQCSVLGHRLLEKGLGVFVQRSARVSHPVPLTVSYFVARALNNGRDEVLVSRIVTRSNRTRIRTVYWNLRTGFVGTWWKFRTHRREVGLSLPAAFGGYAVVAAYFFLKAIGELVTIVRPHLIARLFPV